MAADPAFYLLPAFNTISVADDSPDDPPESWVGRIVKSYIDPSGNFTPSQKSNPAIKVPLSENVSDDPGFQDVEQVIDSARSKAARLSMADMLHISHTQVNKNHPQFTAPKVRKLKLLQEDQYLKRVLLLDEVKDSLKEWKHGLRRPVYMIVSLLVADRVNYAERTIDETTKKVEAKPPSQLAAIAAGSPFSVPELAEASATTSTSLRQSAKLNATGKRIFAVEYRVLTKRLLSTSGQIDMRPGGVRGDRSFAGRDEEDGAIGASSSSAAGEEQQSEVFPDPDPLDEAIDDVEAEEYCFHI